MSVLMYAGLFALLKSDRNLMTDYEKREVLKKEHLVY